MMTKRVNNGVQFTALFNADNKLPKKYNKLCGYPRDLSFIIHEFKHVSQANLS